MCYKNNATLHIAYFNSFFYFSHGDFLTIIELPEGEHQYKFFVDGSWQHNPSEVYLLNFSVSFDHHGTDMSHEYVYDITYLIFITTTRPSFSLRLQHAQSLQDIHVDVYTG